MRTATHRKSDSGRMSRHKNKDMSIRFISSEEGESASRQMREAH
jgi:hypothetical protein